MFNKFIQILNYSLHLTLLQVKKINNLNQIYCQYELERKNKFIMGLISNFGQQ